MNNNQPQVMQLCAACLGPFPCRKPTCEMSAGVETDAYNQGVMDFDARKPLFGGCPYPNQEAHRLHWRLGWLSRFYGKMQALMHCTRCGIVCVDPSPEMGPARFCPHCRPTVGRLTKLLP